MSSTVAIALRYFETLRHLRPVQLANLVTRKLPVSIDRSAAPPLRPRFRPLVPPIDHAIRLSGPDTVVLINRPGRIGDATGWNDPAQPKLWLYNLHYFDWMSGERDAAHRRWERDLIERWIAENPVGEGNGWEPYPVSLRIVNWVKWLFEGNIPPSGMLFSLALQLRMLERTLEWHLLGNHLLANAKAMFIGGCLFGATEGDRWLALGDRLLSEQWSSQILADGGHEERSAMYHALLLEDILDCINIAQAFALERSHVAREGPALAKRMLRWLAAMTHPNGAMALFNDSVPGIAATFADLMDYAERLEVEGRISLEDGLVDLPQTGYLRAQAGRAVLLMDCAPLGAAHQPGHAHADTLGFELSLGGTPIAVSAGTSTYEIGRQRSWERSTAAHNCLVVGSRDSSDVWAGFRVGRRARVVERGTFAGPPHIVAAAHDGYRFMRGHPVVWRRWTLTDSRLLIEDEIRRVQNAWCVVWLHLAPCVVAEVDGCSARLKWARGYADFQASAPLEMVRTSRALSFNRVTEGVSISWAAQDGNSRAEMSWECRD